MEKISKNDLLFNGKYPIIHYADLYKFAPIQKKVLHYTNHITSSPISKNSLLFPGSDVTPAGLARTSTIEKENVYAGGDVIIVDLSSTDIKSKFLTFEINYRKDRIIPLITGTTIRHLHAKELQRLPINYPNLSEQVKIGNLLSKLEETITLLQRKEEKYKTIKKSLLQNLFPEKNQIVPTLRLKGFNDDWQRRKLSEIVKTTIGEFIIKSKQKEDSPYPVYNGGTSYTGFYDNYNNCGDKIIISARGANAGFVNIVRQKYWAGNSCYSLSIINNQEVDLDYLYQMLKQKQHLFTDFQQAANIPSVSKKDVETLEICTSSFEEQKKIGLFLTKLDSLIVFLQKRITTFSNLKKFLLQNMFI